MKKLVIVLTMLTVTLALLANHDDFMKRGQVRIKADYTVPFAHGNNTSLRDAPEYEFITNPFSLNTTFYDYMPGSYCSFPLRKQPDTSQPFGYSAGGYYLAYHTQETSSANRRVFYSYIDANDNLIGNGPIGSQNLWEGYPGIAMDPVTADPMITWHVNADDDATYENFFSYDLYSFAGSPGIWLTPFDVIDNSELVDELPYQFDDDEYLWPYTFIGSSPVDGKRRVYIYANNYVGHGPSGNPSESVLIAYADFNADDIHAQSQLEWTYYTIPKLDQWNAGDPEFQRPFKAMAVKDNYVAFMGYKIHDADASDSKDSLFVLLNDNYGEGDYEYYTQVAEWELDNVELQAPAEDPWLFTTTDGNEAELKWSFQWSGHMNLVFKDDHTLSFIGNLGISFLDDDGSWYYRPGWGQAYPKEITFDLNEEAFHVNDIYPLGANPNDGVPAIPWDLDEDGEVDEWDTDGYPMWPESYPMFGTTADNGFHYSLSHITNNEEQGWLAAVWSDAMNAYKANEGIEGYGSWMGKPELMMSVFNPDNEEGAVWSQPIRMHANSNADSNYVQQFNEMIPCMAYPSDLIEDLGDDHARLPLFFLDDNSYGSSIQNEGDANGGTLMFTALDINMQYDVADHIIVNTNPNEVSASNASSMYNYPNPFNPTTTISYQVKKAGYINIEVFNITGQKVTTLVDENREKGTHNVVWNGKDSNGNSVASGVYFYKLKNGRYTTTKKMILMK